MIYPHMKFYSLLTVCLFFFSGMAFGASSCLNQGGMVFGNGERTPRECGLMSLFNGKMTQAGHGTKIPVGVRCCRGKEGRSWWILTGDPDTAFCYQLQDNPYKKDANDCIGDPCFSGGVLCND